MGCFVVDGSISTFEIDLPLLSLDLFRAVMTDGENIGASRLVLEPVSLAVYVARNLSPWYHDVPDVDVVGKLHAVKVSCV